MKNKISWFLGLLTTDGSIVRPSPRGKGDETHITFCMHHDDSEVLHKVKNILKTSGNVRLYPNYKSPQCQLNIYDRKSIFNTYYDIKKKVPKYINLRHFVRGLVDGDGCLNYRGNRDSFRINIVNESFDILENISNQITEFFGLEKKIPRKTKIYIIEWEGKIARLIAWWLYHGNIEDAVLQRKLLYYRDKLNVVNSSDIDEFLSAVKITPIIHNEGLILNMNLGSRDSLRWCHLTQKILNGGTPIPMNKGKMKYYSLYFPITDTQSISFNQEMMA
jgi:hypothetical protein